MSTDHALSTTESQAESSLMKEMIGYIVKAVNDVNDQAVLERLEKLKTLQPDSSPEALARTLIQQKCLQAGAVGAVTSGASLIPGGGALLTFTFGVAADLSLTLRMQAELVLEIATVYGRRLSRIEKRQTIILVTGIGAASDQLLEKAGAVLAKKATEQLAEKLIEKALPVVSIAASAGKNILTTYLVGQRAQAYFSVGPQAIGDWSDSLKAVTGLDGQRIIAWLAETTERSWQLMSNNTHSAAAATIVAGQSAGEVVVVRIDQISQRAVEAGRSMVRRARTGSETTLSIGQKVGQGMIVGAAAAGRVTVGAGRSLTEGVRIAREQASVASQKMVAAWSREKTTNVGQETILQDIEDIPTVFNQDGRIAEIIAACYDQSEELAAFEGYITNAMQCPFTATWRDPDEAGHAEPVTVLGVDSIDQRRGILLAIQRGDKQRRLLAEQLWADDSDGLTMIILDDYRYWVNDLNGLTPGFG